MSANAAEQAAVRQLDIKEAERKEVCYSMIGPRNTLIFYTFVDQQAILSLTIDNKDESFPVSGRVLLFDEETTEEGLKKWINNQHSDGLYPDIPDPIFTKVLPEGSCVVTAHKQLGITKDDGSSQGRLQKLRGGFIDQGAGCCGEVCALSLHGY